MKQEFSINGRVRTVIEAVTPEIDGGHVPIKRAVGESVVVRGDIFADGHDAVSAMLLYRTVREKNWHELPMRHLGNDRWEGIFQIRELCTYYYTLQAWVDHFQTWQRDVQKKANAGQDIAVDLRIGGSYIEEAAGRALHEDRKRLRDYVRLVGNVSDPSQALSCALEQELTRLMAAYPDKACKTSYARTLAVTVDRTKALFSTWYEMFPRSCGSVAQKPGTFRDCTRLLPELARGGFDVLYLPPIHPIGKTNRKGKNNTPGAEENDPGSPWAIGSADGGHKAVEPSLGSLDDFRELLQEAGRHGIEIALDIAYQCSPDHPYLAERPQWFKKRPDGTIQFAENPPKKYEDIVPFHFETENWQELWEELKSIILFWIEQGVRIFRVDNPHTKPFAFWEWLIGEVKQDYPEVIFLSEAFTRPKVMYRLGKAGFTQSYTYFTWRNTKREITDYLTELTQTECREYFRPNFWPNTPDILSEFLQYGGTPAFLLKLVLAATLSSNYGIYGPAFEHCVTDALPDKEEYLDSEKYQIRHWDWNKPGTIREFISQINRIRRENPALQTTWNLRFYPADNDYLLFYGKATPDFSNIILVAVNLDPFHPQGGWLTVPLNALGIDPTQTYLMHDLISNDKHLWQGERNFFEINPQVMPASIFRVHRRLRREEDFDYFM